MPRFLRILCALGFAATALSVQGSEQVDQAPTILASYIGRSQAFDASMADLYADGALIENRRNPSPNLDHAEQT